MKYIKHAFYCGIFLLSFFSFATAQGWLPLAYNNSVLLSDNFGFNGSHYPDAQVMNGQSPLIGPAWKTTGGALPTTSGGFLVDGGSTGYLYTNLLSTPSTLGVTLKWTGGIDLTAQGFAFATSSQTPPNLSIKSLVHQNFGPTSFTLGTFDSLSVFTALMQGVWTTPMNNTGTIYQSLLGLVGSTAIVVGPSSEKFCVTDPTIGTNWGPMVFWEPLTQGDGLKSSVATAYAQTTVLTTCGTTTLNPSDKNAAMTLSGGNLTAAANATGEAQVRSIAARTNGKVHFEFTINTHANGAVADIGIGESSFTQHALTTFVGGDAKSWGFFPRTTSSQHYTGNVGTTMTGFVFSAGDTGAIEMDFALNKAWVMNKTTNSGWNNDIIANQNPATGTGGLTMHSGGGGPYGITVNLETLNDSVTINTGGSGFAQTPSINFEKWLVNWLLKRDLDPAANDNDPMWLNKAA